MWSPARNSNAFLSASGPTLGHLARPSDGAEPKKIAWLQCVGSRDIQHGGHSYCSGVCCMYAIKEAICAREHSSEPLDTSIFFMDMRTHGKDFEKYYLRARDEYGVRFVRSRIHTVDPIPGEGSLSISYATEDGVDRRGDLRPGGAFRRHGGRSGDGGAGPEAEDRAQSPQFRQDRDGYSRSTRPARASMSCGLFQGPKDIPYAVMEASAAACGAAVDLTAARGSLAREPVIPAALDLSEEAPRIGVFVCNCGINIGSVVNVSEVVSYASHLPGVVFVTENLFSCSQDTQEKIKKVIQEERLNRVVVAACSPRTHEGLFRETLIACGVNKYLFEMANIRDQDSWVHQQEPMRATEKAKDLVSMAVARAALLQPLEERPLEITQRGLVIGGGIAGLNAALSLAGQGFETILIEKDKELGGMARFLQHTIEGMDVPSYLERLVRGGLSTRENPGLDRSPRGWVHRLQRQFQHGSAGGSRHVSTQDRARGHHRGHRRQRIPAKGISLRRGSPGPDPVGTRTFHAPPGPGGEPVEPGGHDSMRGLPQR